MVAPVAQDQRRSPTPGRTDSAAVAHLLVSTLFLALAGILVGLSLLVLTFPDIFAGVLSYGRVRPAALTAAMLGWLIPGMVGGVYYVLPRLTGARLWREDLATLGLVGLAGLTLVGIVVVGLGLGDGVEPFGLPWWLDLPVFVVLWIPALVTVQTVRRRSEEAVYVTVWFASAGVVWLPLLYLFGNLPNLSAVGRELGELHFAAGFSNLWVTAVGTGLAFYAVVKATDNPLASRQLARVGFWSLALAAGWAGPLQLVFGPTPGWLASVAAVLVLALPIGTIANASSLYLTIDRAWEDVGDRPAVLAAAVGVGAAVFVGIATAVAAFRSSAALVAFTSYWDGVLYASLFGVGGLLLGAWAYQAMPAMTGRKLASMALARRHVSLTAWGVGATAVLLMAAGLIAGFGRTGAAYLGAFDDPASSFMGTQGTPDVLIGLSILTWLVAIAGQLAFVFVIYRTITSGEATAQEVLVELPAEVET